MTPEDQKEFLEIGNDLQERLREQIHTHESALWLTTFDPVLTTLALVDIEARRIGKETPEKACRLLQAASDIFRSLGEGTTTVRPQVVNGKAYWAEQRDKEIR